MGYPEVQSVPEADRLERALAAFLRQQLSAPVVTMRGFLDIILEDTKRLGVDSAIPDLERMRVACADLGALVGRVVDQPEAMRKPEESFEEFQSRLRHDLRTPLNAIKGYCELLIEDMRDAGQMQLLPDLAKVREAADQLLLQLDAMVKSSQGSNVPLEEAKPIEIVADLMRAIAPVDVVQRERALASRILVVDDIASNRDLLERRLTREGHQVVAVENGTNALDLLLAENFDLILLDLMMPGMSGFEVLCRLKSSSRTRHIPVIMISALDELDSAVRCIEAGAEDYLPKPFNPILLRAKIYASLEKKWLRDREQKYFEELRAEKLRSESLLLNILPQNVVSRMRAGEAVIADRFDYATILFSDLVGFTALASGFSADRILEMLSTVFESFDLAVREHGLEKIKTIGDAYMVAGGLPEPLPNHTHRVATLAIEMLDIVERMRARLDIDLKVRIGIHVGPVVAGVIGTHKFIYDVWGDTVNTASRMESFGAPGRIHVSAETYDVLRHDFKFEPRGPLEIKGKGAMETYFLMGRAR
jgi:adenylate cyclase